MDVYSLRMNFSIPDLYTELRLTWQSQSLSEPRKYPFEVRGLELYLYPQGWTGTDVVQCKLFEYAQNS